MLEKKTRTLSDTARSRSRSLRRDMTKSERLLWNCLRNRTLGEWKFVRQCPIGPYFADFACREAKLVVELDGEGHDLGHERDMRRDAFLEGEGYRVLRIASAEMLINADGVLSQIASALNDTARRG
jgi:very-short-patch-repair endonuclease